MRNAHSIFSGLLFLALGIQMTDGAEKSLFGLTDEQFWNEPTMQKSAMNFSKELLWKSKPGIFIDMPHAIYTDKKSSVPLCGFRSQSTEFIHKFTLASSCKLVVTNLQNGEIQAVQFARSPDIQDNEKPSPGWVVESISIDLLEQVILDPKLGNFTARIISGPDSSNNETFEIYPNKDSNKHPEIESQIKAARMQGGPTYPPLSLKTFDAEFPAQQQLPGDGPVWEVEAQDSNPAETRIELKFQIAGLPRFVYPKDKPHLGENGRRVYAALPVHLLAFDENRIAVVSEKLGLPVLTPPSGASENPILEGRISMGLSGLLNQNRKPKALSIWVISMGHFALTEIKEIK